MVVVLILAGVAALLAIATVPLLLPWPQQIRWLLASTAIPDPFAMSVVPDPLTLREVTVGYVHGSAERVAVALTEISPVATPSWYVIPASAATLEQVARLQRWSVAHSPLLLITDPDGGASLHGPSHAVVGLRPSIPDAGRTPPGLLAALSSERSHGLGPYRPGVPVSR